MVDDDRSDDARLKGAISAMLKELEHRRNGRRWLKYLPLVIAVVALLGWIEAHYAKAADVKALEDSVATLGAELKITVLENRRSSLRGEQFRLQSNGVRSALERQRLFEVTNDLRDVEQQLGHLRREKR
jgi:hypothetical protein